MTYYIAEIRFNRNKNPKREKKMRKRLTRRLITLLLVSLLFSASIMIVSVAACPKRRVRKNRGECEPVIKSLLELSSEISELPREAFKNPCCACCQRKVLRWKVNVVIWQVMVGAYEGAINKLRNDIRDKIEKWIVDPWKTDLIDKIDYIIDLIESLCRDRKPPIVRIDEPASGSYLSGVVNIRVYVNDTNFDKAELRIKDNFVMQWNSTGTHVFNWNTSAPEYPDGVYTIQLTAHDLAGNFDKETIAVTVDNTPPLINVPIWEPKEPSTDEEVDVSVCVSECGCASGVKNVTLWYRTNDEWRLQEMLPTNGMWTATILGQSAGVNVKFYIEAYDKVGNGAKTSTYDYTVKAPTNLPPVAKFSESAETVYTEESITFNASESCDPDGTIVSYYWDFGDDTNATGVVVEHAYSDNGNYLVTLTVTDDDGATATATAAKCILNSPPVANFTESAETVYTSEVITFNASSSHDHDGTIISYFWDFGDETTVTGAIVDHAYVEDGVYTVTLTVTDDDGTSSSTSATKTVLNRPPVASFTESATTVLTGEVIRFDASSSEDSDGSIIGYLWDFGDGTTAVGVKVNHAYEDDDVYTVTLTVIDDDGAIASTSTTKTVLNRLPVASFTENATVVKKDEVIHFDASESYDPDGNIVSYFWDFGDETNATGVTVDHAYAEDGNYTVILTVTDDDEASSSMSDTKIVEKEEEAAGWPLALLAAIGLGIAALTATLLYGLYRRRKKKRGKASSPGSKTLVTRYVPPKLLAGYS